MNCSLNLPNNGKINEMVGALFKDSNYSQSENIIRDISGDSNQISQSTTKIDANTEVDSAADFSVTSQNQEPLSSSTWENCLERPIKLVGGTNDTTKTCNERPIVSMSSKTSLKIDIVALNELTEGKKGAVKRKARLPRQSFDKPKKGGGKKKKTKPTSANGNGNQNDISSNNMNEEETTEPTSTSSSTQTTKTKGKQSGKKNPPKRTKPPNLKCMTCDKELSNEQNLMKHLLTHNNNHTCMICMKTFKSTHFLRHHMDKHNDGYKYSCDICHKKFKFRNNMIGHMKKHNMVKKFECELCHKKFIGKYNLKEHMKAHSDARPFGCNFCQKAYKDRGALNKHLLTHQEKKVECTVCNRQFSSDKQVERHMQFHYSWPGDSFKRKTNIDGNGEKIKYQCEFCDKTFNHYSNMNAHVHKKHKEKKIQCPQCPKMFAYQYELREHMFIHLGAESTKFKCQVCDKSFQRSTTLKNHERTTHLGIRRFKCEICGKMFGTKFNMKVHVEKLHNENNINSGEQKSKRGRKNASTPVGEAALIVHLPPPPAVPSDHHLLPQLAVSLPPPPHQHPLLRNVNTNDIIRNAIAHIPELGYFPPLQPPLSRGYPFFGIPPLE